MHHIIFINTTHQSFFLQRLFFFRVLFVTFGRKNYEKKNLKKKIIFSLVVYSFLFFVYDLKTKPPTHSATLKDNILSHRSHTPFSIGTFVIIFFRNRNACIRASFKSVKISCVFKRISRICSNDFGTIIVFASVFHPSSIQ